MMEGIVLYFVFFHSRQPYPMHGSPVSAWETVCLQPYSLKNKSLCAASKYLFQQLFTSEEHLYLY